MRGKSRYDQEKISNMDISYLRYLTRPAYESTILKPQQCVDVNGLFQILRLKNSKYSFTQESKKSEREWMRKRGGNLDPLIERI